ncbi:NAD(P)H-dependent flavin oxidoreductase [Hydrogenophaga sp. BPS33]|uniref:NAD(P)H-dependent flavin oxidoreductase n=1 Tax=Hydrogenophaga sp. BPS33 TaxID=2651974 RepID=UPI0019174D2C|nr:nitronate monooxygenase [Hydrogenophaga sp. BPS33]
MTDTALPHPRLPYAERLRLPLVCAPMYRVTSPELVIAANQAGIVGALPRNNAPDFATFDAWLARIQAAAEAQPVRAPYAVNLSTRFDADEMERHLTLCARRGVELIISATGDPSELIRRAHGHGLQVYADAVNLHFARKAMAAQVDGVIAIGAGGGGHSGTVNHLSLVAALRREFTGVIVMAGAVSNGAAIRAAEILGADLAYMGTRFIATQEAGAPEAYKQMLVDAAPTDLAYTDSVNGVSANWLVPSLRAHGLDPRAMPARDPGVRGHAHLPEAVVPWQNLWSAGQGVAEIHDIPTVAQLLQRLEAEYHAAAATPVFARRAAP